MNPASAVRSFLSWRFAHVLFAAILVWGLAVYDFAQPRGSDGLNVGGPQQLIGVTGDELSRFVTSSGRRTRFGVWEIRPSRGRVQVTGLGRGGGENLRPAYEQDIRLRSNARADHYDVDRWGGEDAMALFALRQLSDSAHLTAYELTDSPRLVVDSSVPLPRQTSDFRHVFVATWSGPRTDLIVVDSDLRTAAGSSPNWEVQIFSGESRFTRRLTSISIRNKLSRRLSRNSWWIDLGPIKGPRPDLILVTRDGATQSETTEIHALSGKAGYQYFSLHAPTGLGESPGGEFLYQPEPRGGAVLYLAREDREVSVRAIQLGS